jgi:hypothetical protein
MGGGAIARNNSDQITSGPAASLPREAGLGVLSALVGPGGGVVLIAIYYFL